MSKLFAIALLAAMLLPAVSALAAEPAPAPAAQPAAAAQQAGWYFFPPGRGTIALGVSIGLGLIIIGAGKGIGNIGAHATDAIARQPEAGGRIFTTMIISAALIEGVTLFAIVVALLTMILGDF
jgi:F-type H+-transporting ATPase subunit c